MQYGLLLWGFEFLIVICSFTDTVKCITPTFCNVSSNVASLILSDSEAFITENLLHLCSGNFETLRVSGGAHRHLISHRFFELSHYPYLKNVYIHVASLSISNDGSEPGGFSNLSLLSLSNCGITDIPLGIFRTLPNLERFDLSNNLISDMPADFLMYSPKVIHVDLSNNRLKFLPKFHWNEQHVSVASINVSMNPILCHCANIWLMDHWTFFGIPHCDSSMQPCNPSLVTHLKANYSESTEDVKFVSVLATQSISFTCQVVSRLPVTIFWISPLGVIPPHREASEFNFSYHVQPVLIPTSIKFSTSNLTTTVQITNIRGHLAGDWYCAAQSKVDIVVSKPLNIVVTTSIYHSQIYYLSLCYGYGGMIALLLIGIAGGTIRYCSETRCLRRPQPPFDYGGKAFIGVIPVPEFGDDNFTEKLEDGNVGYDIAETSVRYISAQPLCSACSRPPTYWFCLKCKSVHFVESVLDSLDSQAVDDIPLTGILTAEGEIKIDDPVPFIDANNVSRIGSDPVSIRQHQSDPHEPLMKNVNVTTGFPLATTEIDSNATIPDSQCVYVRSGTCIIRVINGTGDDKFTVADLSYSSNSISGAICMHSKPRTKSVDVKLVVSNEQLAEEYRTALEDLARAVENPDPARFREYLEDFRSRLRRDVGHGVKVLRGEFRGLRAKSVKGVTNLRNQGTAAAQKVRAGISYGVEQVRGSMRSVAELCGASGTIGQTISVVSVYIDETDQVKKERVISDFIF